MDFGHMKGNFLIHSTSEKYFPFIKYPTLRGHTAEARRTTILQAVEQKPHSQKDRQDEKAEGYVPDERTR